MCTSQDRLLQLPQSVTATSATVKETGLGWEGRKGDIHGDKRKRETTNSREGSGKADNLYKGGVRKAVWNWGMCEFYPAGMWAWGTEKGHQLYRRMIYISNIGICDYVRNVERD